MSDWEPFTREVSWFVQPGESVAVGEARAWTRGPVDGLPELSALLESAAVTPVTVAGNDYELLAWGPAGDRRGWLCPLPREAADGEPIPRLHKDFWKVCGGIVERFGEPQTWWMNQNQVLTADAARVGVGGVLDEYSWLWEDDGRRIPIAPDDYYVAAVEANGNLTLAGREDGRLLLFAPDHSFAGVTPVANALLTIDAVPDLRTWIEVCAAAWRRG